MRRPIRFSALAAAAVCTVAVSGCSASVDSAEAPPAHHVAYLWAVGAEDAAIVQDDGVMYIELSGVENVITRFSAVVGEAAATVSAAITEFRASSEQANEGAAALAPGNADSLDRISVNVHQLSELSGAITEVSESIAAGDPGVSPGAAAVLVSNGLDATGELDVDATQALLEELKAAMSERSLDLEAEIAFIQSEADALEKAVAERLARVIAAGAEQIAAGVRPK